MRIFDSNEITSELHEIYITINVPDSYAEMVEIYREGENGPGFVQVTSVKMIETSVSFDQDDNNDMRRFLP